MYILEYYLEEMQKPNILYHAASHLTKTLIPRRSAIGTLPKNVKTDYNTKGWEKRAIFAAIEKNQAIPFGLERKNFMWAGANTKEEVDTWKYGCYLSVNKDTNILQMNYYNYIPKNPVYLYTVDSKDFKMIQSDNNPVKQWYSTKEVIPLNLEKLLPNQIKGSWKEISKVDWERKKQKYTDKGYYK